MAQRGVSWFPGASATKDHTLGGFEQKEFILSQFWSQRSERAASQALREDPSLPLSAFGSLRSV